MQKILGNDVNKILETIITIHLALQFLMIQRKLSELVSVSLRIYIDIDDSCIGGLCLLKVLTNRGSSVCLSPHSTLFESIVA